MSGRGFAGAGGWLLAFVLPLAGGAAVSHADTAYRWTDADGTVHYGSIPPADADAQAVDITTGIPASAPEADAGSGGASATAADDVSPETPVAEAAQTEPRALSDEQCERLEQSRMQLQNVAVGLLVEGEDGEPRRMPSDEREERLEETEALLADHC